MKKTTGSKKTKISFSSENAISSGVAKIISSHLIDGLLERMTKNLHFSVGIDGKEAVRLGFDDKKIIVEIRNPVLAAQLAVETSLLARKFRKMSSDFKKLGYRMEIRYGFLTVDI